MQIAGSFLIVFKVWGKYWRSRGFQITSLVLFVSFSTILVACTNTPSDAPSAILGDSPGITAHASNTDLENEAISLTELLGIGSQIFSASFNTLDGSGNFKQRFLNQSSNSNMISRFNRISGPDSNACSGCHNLPTLGGGGDNVANVFVLAHKFPNVQFDGGPGDLYEDLTLSTVGNERGTISMFGAGYIELLAREMTTDLHKIREKALAQAKLHQKPVTLAAQTKGVSFGKLTAWPDGLIDASKIEGVDVDLIIKPFSQKGVYTSLREFTLDSIERHHGLQPEERFGRDTDPDYDGVSNELTAADITALTLFQATLPPPSVNTPQSEKARSYAEKGEGLFSIIGCAVCHKPFLELNNSIFSEPNPYNPPGTNSTYAVQSSYNIDLTTNAKSNSITSTTNGTFLVRAFTDLKRHDMGPIAANETIEQRYVESPFWITRKLWGATAEPPYLHHGRATLIAEAITTHQGEADPARINFEQLSANDQAAIIEFIKTL